MTAINLDDQLVATAYDKQNRVCSYTYQHTDGSRYTVQVPLDELIKLGTTPASAAQRRKHLAMKILNHIQTCPPDDVRV
jgi:hypothetical protein